MNLKERIINGLWAQAVCDAVGYKFEFQDEFKPNEVTDFAKNTSHLTITDDTQMALFGFEAIERTTRMSGGTQDKVTQSFTQSYIDWYYTQNASELKSTGLLQFEELYHQRAPGFTCLAACKTLQSGGMVDNQSSGCGSVMRLLPILMLYENNLMWLNSWAISTALITHKHEENSRATTRYIFNACYNLNNKQCINKRLEKVSHISEIGEGWTALECVDMAIWAYQSARTFDELLEISIAHPGDSDSVAAIAGSLWGLAGKEVPQEYIDKLVEKNVIKYVINNYIETFYANI